MIKHELSSLLIAAIASEYKSGQYITGNKIRLLKNTDRVIDKLKLSFDSFGVSAKAKLFPYKAKHDDKGEDLEIKYEFPVLQSYWNLFNTRRCLDFDRCVSIKVLSDFLGNEDEEFNVIKKIDLTILNNIALKDMAGGYSHPTLGRFDCYIDIDVFVPKPILKANERIAISISFPDFVINFPELKAIYTGIFQEGWDLIEKIHCVATRRVFLELKKPFLATAEK